MAQEVGVQVQWVDCSFDQALSAAPLPDCGFRTPVNTRPLRDVDAFAVIQSCNFGRNDPRLILQDATQVHKDASTSLKSIEL
jgi:hypothetical protein